MSYTHVRLAEIDACFDYSEHPDQARLALEAIARCQHILDDPRYQAIRMTGWASGDAHDLRYWATRDAAGNENDIG